MRSTAAHQYKVTCVRPAVLVSLVTGERIRIFHKIKKQQHIKNWRC